jgi:hypothetical protein
MSTTILFLLVEKHIIIENKMCVFTLIKRSTIADIQP